MNKIQQYKPLSEGGKIFSCSFEEIGNPFLEQSEDILVLDTKDILDASVAEAVRKAETLGVDQHQQFVEESLV